MLGATGTMMGAHGILAGVTGFVLEVTGATLNSTWEGLRVKGILQGMSERNWDHAGGNWDLAGIAWEHKSLNGVFIP